MKKSFLLLLVFCLLAFFSACRASRSSSTSTPDSDDGGIQIFGNSDQTQEAADLVYAANEDLNKVKKIYKENEHGVQDLTEAINQKDVEKVKQIADDLVYKINDGMNIGTEAVAKIEKAQELKINETFKEYLSLKELALQKQLDAFEFRRQAGIKIRDAYGEKDKLKIDLAKADLVEKEKNFKLYMDQAKEMSMRANQIYKDSLRKTE